MATVTTGPDCCPDVVAQALDHPLCMTLWSSDRFKQAAILRGRGNVWRGSEDTHVGSEVCERLWQAAARLRLSASTPTHRLSRPTCASPCRTGEAISRLGNPRRSSPCGASARAAGCPVQAHRQLTTSHSLRLQPLSLMACTMPRLRSASLRS